MNKKGLLALTLAMCLLLSGCLFRPPDDLYALPKVSAGYEQLNDVIAEVQRGLETEYGISPESAVIVSGDNTATVQLQDLDGDGARESAVTFLRVPGVERSLKICIFSQLGEDYRLTGLVEGDGSSIYSVDYVELNGSGKKELVVNWQLSNGVYQLGVYTLDELSPLEGENDSLSVVLDEEKRAQLMATELLLVSCSAVTDSSGTSSGYRLVDIDQDTSMEIAVARVDSGGMGSQIEVYGWEDGAFRRTAWVELSSGISTLNQIRANYLSGELYPPALYVTSTLVDGSRVIDVLAYQDGRLVNLALRDGISVEILQAYIDVSPSDINGDNVLELPSPRALPSQEESSSSNFWLIEWFQYNESGERSYVMTTYHNVADSWYLKIPESWRDQITISRNDQVSGQREVIFSHWRGEGQEPEPFLSIYRLTGSRRSTNAAQTGRFILQEEESVIYAAKFYDSQWDCGLDQADLLDRFVTISPSWYS